MNAYQNPYRLFDLSVEATATEIATYKERLVYSLQPYALEEEVYVRHSKVPKHLVLQLIGELEKFELRNHHQAIFHNKKLLNFLEYGQLNYFRSPKPSNLDYDADFYAFIAPYFAHQYGETLAQAIRTQNTEVLQLLGQTTLPRVAGFEEQCYEYANAYVEDTIQALQELQEQPLVNDLSKKQLLGYLPNRTIELYNLLPDYFYAARNLIGNQVYQTALALTQKFNRGDAAVVLINQGLKLRLDQSVRRNLEELNDNFKIRAKVPLSLILAVVIIALLYALRYLETNYWGN